MGIWRPVLPVTHTTPLYLRLVKAMATDVDSGALAAGTRLPPQRELAHALSISIGAVTRAYDAPAGEPFDRCVRAMRALMHSPGGISAAIATNWIESGRADDLARDVIAEARARTTIARAALGDRLDMPQAGVSLHLWLPLPEIDAEHAVARTSAAGLRLTSPAAFAISHPPTFSGLRLCVGSVPNHETLARALAILKTALDGKVDDRMRALL